MNRRLKPVVLLLALLLIAASWTYQNEVSWFVRRLPLINRFFRPTIESQIAAYGQPARARLEPKFSQQHLPYPPNKIALLAIKKTEELEIYSIARNGNYRYVCTYPILGASGHLGPKLRSGDRQVPEGIYELSLEPNTPYHVALRLNYPNETDLARAKVDGRNNPGSDILIHGTTGSVGCLAVGDQASEDLFVLAYDTRDHKIPLVIAPVDLRSQQPPDIQPTDPRWLPQLYREIKDAMASFPTPSARENNDRAADAASGASRADGGTPSGKAR